MVTGGRSALSRDASSHAAPWRFAVGGSVAIHVAVAAGLLAAAAMARPEIGVVADAIAIELVAAGAATDESAAVAGPPVDARDDIPELAIDTTLPVPEHATTEATTPIPLATEPPPPPTEPSTSELAALPPAAATMEPPKAVPSPAARARPASAPPRSARRAAPKAIDTTAVDRAVGTTADNAAATPTTIASAQVPAAGIPVVTRAQYRETPTPPVYPRRARDLNVTGTTILRALVDRDGRTKDVRVWRSSGSEALDEAAAAAARRWAFAPAQIDDRTVEAWVEIPVKFELM